MALEPLAESHLEGLAAAASDGELWNLSFTGVPHPDNLAKWYADCLEELRTGRQIPFVVRILETGKVVGSTRFYDLEPSHRNLAIGYTWYAKSAQRTFVNTEAKLLLLTHAFEVCNCIAVFWHTHHENKPSQQAIGRLGAQLDGVIRNHKIMPNGELRDTFCYSMLDTEWPEAKKNLIVKLAV
ncbi:MAG TPA: N-acetyltransferase [Gammaproteobacteria bacterium]|nr:N-acetyltransferase [Gammaproteobacteria bacterium]